MRTFEKSHKLDYVCYDIRGPVMDEAQRMAAQGMEILKLNIGNPAPFGFRAPDKVIEKMSENLTNTEGYSDSKGLPQAREAILKYCKSKSIPCESIDDIYTGNGVSELITMSMQGLLNYGDEVLVPSPDYPLWTASVTLAGGTAVHYHCDEAQEWYPDIEDMKKKITPKTKGIVVINPNNPTGRTAQPELLREIVRKCTENGVKLVVDECFNDFLTDAERHTRKDLLESNPGLIILRAYTKMYAVPGVRFGWCMTADAALIEKLYHAGQPWNVSVIAQACAVAAANEPDWATETAKRIAEERRFLSDNLSAHGLKVFPGEANFLLFRSNDTGLHKKLAEHGIMIRNCDNYRGLSAGYYRVAVKTREASERLLQIITNYTQCEV